jgi:LysR family transcriptional regulator, transcriptional activator of nhaA
VLNYNHLYYFHVTATEGTVARAAQRLGVGQPTVSEQIRALERALDTALFERTGGKLRLTDAGRTALEHTSIMFRAGERLAGALSTGRTAPAVSLRVGVSATVARSVAADFLMPLLTLPDCTPILRGGECHDLVRDLRARDLDLVLCEADPGIGARPELDVIEIHKPRLIAIGTAEPEDPQWTGARVIHFRQTSVYRADVDAFLEERGLRPAIAAETDDTAFMMTAVARGGFIAFVPWTLAKDAVTAGRLRVLGEVSSGPNAVHALYHTAETANIARRAVELLVAEARSVETR